MVMVFVESAVGLVPRKYWRHPAVVNWCRRFNRRPEEAVLDINYHYAFMKDWDNPGKYGRPDILHYSLLCALESPLAKEGLLDVFFHTIDGRIFYIERGTRLPRAYNRFVGILSTLLRGGDTPRIHPVNKDITELLGEYRKKGFRILLMDEGGRLLKEEDLKGDVVVLIGAFPEGSFIYEYPVDDRISLWKEPLNAWNVAGEVIASKERMEGLL